MAVLTVREAFERAFGPIPEGATVHIGIQASGWDYNVCHCPTFMARDEIYTFPILATDARWQLWDEGHKEQLCFGPDVSDRDARAFIGFFGPEYDKVVGEAFS